MSWSHHPQQASFSEIVGLVVGGSALVAIVSMQVLFVVWML